MKRLFFFYGLLLAAVPGAEWSPLYNGATDLQWYGLQEAQQLARENDKKVLVHMYVDWCPYCQKMEEEVYPQENIQALIEEYFYPVKINLESDGPVVFNGDILTEARFGEKMKVQATPTTCFIDGNGNILGAQPGFIRPEIFEKLLSYVGSNAYTKMKFKDYLEEIKGQ